jgi:hypothetical protein
MNQSFKTFNAWLMLIPPTAFHLSPFHFQLSTHQDQDSPQFGTCWPRAIVTKPYTALKTCRYSEIRDDMPMANRVVLKGKCGSLILGVRQVRGCDGGGIPKYWVVNVVDKRHLHLLWM